MAQTSHRLGTVGRATPPSTVEAGKVVAQKAPVSLDEAEAQREAMDKALASIRVHTRGAGARVGSGRASG